MIKVKVIKSFYCAKGKKLYLDENRYKELSELGYVEEIKKVTKNNKVEKIIDDKTRILSN